MTKLLQNSKLDTIIQYFSAFCVGVPQLSLAPNILMSWDIRLWRPTPMVTWSSS